MKKNFTISLFSIIVSAIVFFCGYLIGRGFADKVEVEKEVVKYKKEYLPSIRDTIYQPLPHVVFLTDTVDKIINRDIEIDTLKVIADYYKIRKYDFDFSNDTIGTVKFKVDVSENKIDKVVSDIKPIINTIETIRYINKVKTIQFFTILGTSTNFDVNKIQLGIDLRQKYLLGVSGIRVKDKYEYTLDLGIKF